MKEQRAIPGVLGINVDLPREDRGTHDVGRPELQLAFRVNATRPKRGQGNIAKKRAFRIDLGGYDHCAITRYRGGKYRKKTKQNCRDDAKRTRKTSARTA
jgi:hypothetical protein